MLNGRLYDAATMNEVGATPKTREPFFFERTPGVTPPSAGAGTGARHH
jgi:hypothetical protein